MIRKLFIGMVLLGASVISAQAQSKHRALIDPSYSPHNYKHPNKAAQAAAEESKKKIVGKTYNLERQQLLFTPRTAGNYKAQSPLRRDKYVTTTFPGNSVQHTLNPLQNKNNYKTNPTKAAPKVPLKPQEDLMVESEMPRVDN